MNGVNVRSINGFDIASIVSDADRSGAVDARDGHTITGQDHVDQLTITVIWSINNLINK